MLTKETDVKSAKNLVGVATYPIYQGVDEAVEDLGDERLLSILNAQIRTNAMNEVRAAATATPSKSRLYKMATQAVVTDPKALQALSQDPSQLDALIEAKLVEIKADLKEKKIEGGEDDGGDDNEDDE